MNIQAIPYTLPLFISTLILVMVTYFLWRDRRQEPRARAGLLIILACAVWIGAYAMQILSLGLSAKIFWEKIKYIGITTAPTAFFIYILYFTGRERYLNIRTILALVFVPLITLLLACTQESHDLIYRTQRVVQIGGLALLERTYGPWLRGYIIYSYTLVAFTFVLAIRILGGRHTLYKRQIRVMIFAGAVIVLTNIAEKAWFPALGALDMEPFILALTTPIVTWGLFRLRLGDIRPLAHTVIIDTIMDPVFVLDEQNRLVEINPAAEQLLNIQETDVFGQSIDTVWPDWALLESDMDHSDQTIAEIVSPFENIPRTFDVKISPLYNVHRKMISRIVVLRDITERKRYEDELKTAYKELQETQGQLVQSGKLASIGELASGIAHELNQPLMVIRTNTQYLLQRLNHKTTTGEEIRKQLEPIERNTGRMMAIIKHLRVFSRQSDVEFHAVDINRVIDDALMMVGEQLRIHDIEVIKQYGSNLPPVRGNPNQLEQVFLNLITNARDAIQGRRKHEKPEDRRDVIEIQTRPSHHLRDTVDFLMKDTGNGIPEADLDKIFDPFYTTKAVGKGTGLGLSIVYGIIQNHGGEIEVLETGPTGTVIRVSVPTIASSQK